MDQHEDLRRYEDAMRAQAAGEIPKENPLFTLGDELIGEFTQAQVARQETEERWLCDLRQYKGQYEPDEEKAMEDAGGSQQFIRKTRVKVESVDARMTDLLFPATRERNFSMDATPEPTVPPEKVQEITQLLMQANEGQPDRQTIKKAVKAFVRNSARKMATLVDDQLTEAGYKAIARKVIHSGNLYGTGILKGPLVDKRIRSQYRWEGGDWTYKTNYYRAPFISHVSIWRFYPDMAVTCPEDCRYMWEHHRLGRAALAEMAEKKTFDSEAIKEHIASHPDGCIKLMTYEDDLFSMSDSGTQPLTIASSGQYDVYERWGYLTGEQLQSAGVEIPQDRLHEAFFSNVWVLCGGQVIKAVLQPIDGVLWPYHWYYYDKDETSIFGEGLAAIMREDQRAINSAARMLLDNAAITAGPQFEVNAMELAPDTDLKAIHPLKIWARVAGNGQYPAIRELRFDSHMSELANIIELFDRSADETTAIPKFTYGDNPKGGAAATSSGLSMLLGQANIAIKDQVANFDEVTSSFITALYHWNMKYSRDPDVKGDFDVKATGASSLVAKEVRAQALAQYSQSLQPEERGFIKWPKLAQARAEVMELSDVVMDDDEIRDSESSPMAQMQQQMQQQAAQMEIATKQAMLSKLESEAANKRSEAMLKEIEAMNKRVEAVFAAMQGGATAVQNPGAAAAGDSILKSVGWQDATPEDGVAGPVEGSGESGGTMLPQPPADPNTGQRAGIETVEIE